MSALPEAPSTPKKNSNGLKIAVVVGATILGLAAIGSMSDKTDSPVADTTYVMDSVDTSTDFVASNGYTLDASEQLMADTAWDAQTTSDQNTVCSVMANASPDGPIFQAGVRGFANGSGWSMAESQAVVEYVVSTYC